MRHPNDEDPFMLTLQVIGFAIAFIWILGSLYFLL